MNEFLVTYLTFNLLLSFIPAYVAGQKGRSFAGFFILSFFVSFLIALIVSAAIPPASEVISSTQNPMHGDRVACPHCAEVILAQAKVCKHCGRDVKPRVAALLPSGSVKCSACGFVAPALRANNKITKVCEQCGAKSDFLEFGKRKTTEGSE
jgi:hypothetical protein